MGPKKKKQTEKKGDEPENSAKPIAQEPKKDVKEVKQTVNQPKPQEAKKDAKKSEEPKAPEPKIVRTESESQKKINLGDTQKLSEAQLMQRRKLRFNLVGTEVNAQEAQKVKKGRIQKFGSIVPESKEDLQKRKQKFSNQAAINLNEDQSTLDKRKEKFGNSGGLSAQVAEDPSVVQQRKKKFGGNDISLDDQIQKNKEKNNFNKNRFDNNRHRNDFKRSKPHYHQSRDKYEHSGNKRFKR